MVNWYSPKKPSTIEEATMEKHYTKKLCNVIEINNSEIQGQALGVLRYASQPCIPPLAELDQALYRKGKNDRRGCRKI